MKTCMIPVLSFALVAGLAFGAEAQTPERWIHPKCAPLDVTLLGPFFQNEDGTLFAVDKNMLKSSPDAGKTWVDAGGPIDPGLDLSGPGQVGQLLRTRDGVIVFVFLDMSNYNFTWDDAAGAPKPDCKLELWAIRSVDGGKTWSDKQRLFDGYNADFMGFIQTKSGRLVTTVEHLVPELKRWISCSFWSDDEGKTWKQSNWIDLGGHGHHDGAVEPMVTQLGDGRLLMLIRTNLDRFWAAYSEDDGRYWRTIKPTTIDASSAPGWLARLASGRLALVWNRLNPEGRTAAKSIGGGPTSEEPASWHREELSLAFSDNDGETWSTPTVIARHPGGQIAYPYLFERKPGELWLITHYNFDGQGKTTTPVCVRLLESDFAGTPAAPSAPPAPAAPAAP